LIILFADNPPGSPGGFFLPVYPPFGKTSWEQIAKEGLAPKKPFIKTLTALFWRLIFFKQVLPVSVNFANLL
jgi:hypothetical protein